MKVGQILGNTAVNEAQNFVNILQNSKNFEEI